MVEIGKKAPQFTLPETNGGKVSLADFKGKIVVLYFYPKDKTSGCTKEACGFRDVYGDYLQKNTIIIGVSKDSCASHLKFMEKHQLPFLLFATKTTKLWNNMVFGLKKVCTVKNIWVPSEQLLLSTKKVKFEKYSGK